MRIPAEAVWIGSAHPFDLHEAYINFRRVLTLETLLGSARLFITADSRYRLWVNGVHVARGPARSWPQTQQVDAIDISTHLRIGRNVIAVQVYSPGYSHFAAVHRGACGVLAWLDCDGDVTWVTDQHWRVRRDGGWRDDVARVSIYGSGVERRDLRLAEAWYALAFDDAAWSFARVVAPAEGQLWAGLVLRDVPLLQEVETALHDRWCVRHVAASDIADPHEALRHMWALAGQSCKIWVFDLGSSCVCQAVANVASAHGGERLLISYAEKLRDGDVLLSDPETYCRMRLTDEFILRPGVQTVEGFSFRGGRYLIFALCSAVELDISFAVRRMHYPLAARTVRFADAELQAIAELCRRTLLSCLQDGFVDSVWRESSQWLGDGVAQAFALAAISDDYRPLRRLITMAADGAYDDGILPSVLPGDVHAYAITDYNFSWHELLAMYQGPDRDELIAAMRPVAHKMLLRFTRDIEADGLIRSQAGRRLFLDWSGVERREPSLTYNARYLHALQAAHSLGLDACSAHADALRQAMTAAFFRNGRWHENLGDTPASQLGLALLLLTGLSNEGADAIVARSLDLDDTATAGKLVLASPFMHHYVFQALHLCGRDEDIVAIIRARWGRWAKSGEATCWENWNVDFPDGSKCHGFSAHPLGWLARLRGLPDL